MGEIRLMDLNRIKLKPSERLEKWWDDVKCIEYYKKDYKKDSPLWIIEEIKKLEENENGFTEI